MIPHTNTKDTGDAEERGRLVPRSNLHCKIVSAILAVIPVPTDYRADPRV
jgi:hypothetical protein